jgi:hypothetical protein
MFEEIDENTIGYLNDGNFNYKQIQIQSKMMSILIIIIIINKYKVKCVNKKQY